MSSAPVLVTGVAGFIGHATAHRLLDRGERVLGVDVVNDYYDPALKEARLRTFEGRDSFEFHRLDIADSERMVGLVRDNSIARIIHLAAQAGVRYSLENPFAYQHSNLAGHLSVMERAGRQRASSISSMPPPVRCMAISRSAARASVRKSRRSPPRRFMRRRSVAANL